MTSDYPAPLIIPPRALPHKQTFILLHGRGSWAEKFGPHNHPQGQTPGPPPPPPTTTTVQTLAAAFPHARFVFPTAARRRATTYRRAYAHQWFDNWKLDPPATDREELQMPGLRETTAYLHGLLRAEIDAVPGGAANVVLGGLSQGCAAALVALLLWEGPPLATAFGMCGWLPFAARLVEEAVAGGGRGDAKGKGDDDDVEEEDDLFETGEDESAGEDGTEQDPTVTAIRWLRDELELFGEDVHGRRMGSVFQQTPVFLGHGVEDDRVSAILGRNAAACLETLGVRTFHFNEYEGLAHWYSGEMLRDIVKFLKMSTRWEEG
ncbi:alpha/beta-hydrolase [Achaetomium macrosporum]|uniref:Alpha/beta-hydrolase n=1 Tax=Achaetomium macrosporum TaxID=79813 RepID=A0AAN7HDS9_9PEZI|nr:alpha/beta-hydrolase [Achaetomium macrosporum]